MTLAILILVSLNLCLTVVVLLTVWVRSLVGQRRRARVATALNAQREQSRHPTGPVALYRADGTYLREEITRMREIGAPFPIPPPIVRDRTTGLWYRLTGKDTDGRWKFVEQVPKTSNTP